MLEKIIELLLGLAVAAGGAVGISSATEHVGSVDADVPGSAEFAEQKAERVAWAFARAAEAGANAEAADGLTVATEALTRAGDNAPWQADSGLATAWEAVTTGGADAATTEHGAPADVPLVTTVPAQVPASVAAPLPVPPVTQAPPAVTPPVEVPVAETPAGPPSDTPSGGRP